MLKNIRSSFVKYITYLTKNILVSVIIFNKKGKAISRNYHSICLLKYSKIIVFKLNHNIISNLQFGFREKWLYFAVSVSTPGLKNSRLWVLLCQMYQKYLIIYSISNSSTKYLNHVSNQSCSILSNYSYKNAPSKYQMVNLFLRK